MNWDAIGAIGELVGALAVILTLGFLAVQVRQNTRAMEESNRLERVAALDRHTDTVSRWRGRLAEHSELTRIWELAHQGRVDELDEVEHARLAQIWIDLVNTQRSNFMRARTVGQQGLATQAARAIAVEIFESPALGEHWKWSRSWHALASPEFTESVDRIVAELAQDPDIYLSPSQVARRVRGLTSTGAGSGGDVRADSVTNAGTDAGTDPETGEQGA